MTKSSKILEERGKRRLKFREEQQDKKLNDNWEKFTLKYPNIEPMEEIPKNCTTCFYLREKSSFEEVSELLKQKGINYRAHIVDLDNNKIQYCETTSPGGFKHYFQIPNPSKSVCTAWQLDTVINLARSLIITRAGQEIEKLEKQEVKREKLESIIKRSKKAREDLTKMNKEVK